jgi:YVTN family beta-propeller protein
MHSMRLLLLLALSASEIFVMAALPFARPDTGSSHGWLLVANKGEGTLGIIDPAAGKQIAVIPVEGVTGHEVAATPDGKLAFVPIYGNSGVGLPGTNGSKITVIDLESRKVTTQIDIGHGVRPHCAVFNPADGRLYVTSEVDKDIQIIDPHTLKFVGTVPTGQPESHMLAISSDGKRGYTANVGPGTVSVLDLVTRKVTAVIPVAHTIQRISISTDNRWVFTADQGEPRLAVIDTDSNAVKQWVKLPDAAYGTAPTRDGKWLLITQPKTSKVAVLDLATMKIAHIIDVPANPQEIVVRPDDRRAYVSCIDKNQVAVLDLYNWKLDRAIDAGKGADGLSWAARK